MAQSRRSCRLNEEKPRIIINDSEQRRRQQKTLKELEADNYQKDAFTGLVTSKKRPFEMEKQSNGSKKKGRSVEYYQVKYSKSLQQMVYEDQMEANRIGSVYYVDVTAEESNLPPRHFCVVCGFFGHYACLACGARYCGVDCMKKHKLSKCLVCNV